MRLSIVIVCYQGDSGALLDGVLAQRLPDDEVIVVDNAPGGTPGIRGHAAIDQLIEPARNLGFAAGANLGAETARGDAIVLLNPDVVLEPGCLDALRRPAPGWDAWTGVVVLPGGAGVNAAGGESHFLGLSWAARLGAPLSTVPPGPHPTGFLSGACLAVRRSVWEALGGFAGHFFLYFEDVDLSHRLRLSGRRFGVVPAARVTHDYAFAKGGYKWRWLERNRWLTIVRTYPAPLLTRVLPLLLLCELPLLAVAIAGGWAPMKLRAWLDVLRWLPRARRERREVQALAAVSAATFAAGLTAELSSPMLGRVGSSRLLAALLRGYWRLVQRALARHA